MTYQFRYNRPEDVTPAGLDGREVSFPFSYVSTDLIGAPEVKTNTAQHRVIISISGSAAAVWNLSEEDLLRVLFEHARRWLKGSLTKYYHFSSYTIRAPMITTASHPGKCELDPARIPRTEGFVEEMEIQRRIGFSG